MAAVGCGAGDEKDVVVEGTPPATPYGGPLDVATKELDESTPQALRIASGAAGRALECDGEISSGDGPDGWSERDGGDTPEEGLRLYFDMFEPARPATPASAWSAGRRTGCCTRTTWTAGPRSRSSSPGTRRGGRAGARRPNASCDPPNFPRASPTPASRRSGPTGTASGCATTTLSSGPGAEHCGWQTAHFLGTGRGEETGSTSATPTA